MRALSSLQTRHTPPRQDASVRVTGSVLGVVERPLLLWLARSLPAAITSDQLTAIGVLGALITFSGYVLSGTHDAFLWLASLGLVVNWFGDSLDGTLARLRRLERPRYGFLVDHTSDLVSQVLVTLGLGLSPFVRFDVACLGLIMFLAFVAFSMMKTVVQGRLQISYVGIGPTELRCMLIAINTLLFLYPPPVLVVLWEPLTILDLFFLALSVFGTVLLVFSALSALRKLSLAEGNP